MLKSTLQALGAAFFLLGFLSGRALGVESVERCFSNSPVDRIRQVDFSSFSDEGEGQRAEIEKALDSKRKTEALFEAAEKNLGSATYTGDYSAAERAGDAALVQAIHAFGEGDICTAPFIDEAAVVAASANHIAKAHDLYLRAIQITEKPQTKQLDNSRRFLAELCHNLAAVDERSYDEAQANKYREKERAIDTELGIDYDRLEAWMQPSGLESYLGPATGARLLEQYAVQFVGSPYISQFYLWHALKIVEANGGPANPLYQLFSENYATMLSSVSELEGNRNRFEQAVHLQEQALTEAEKKSEGDDALATECYIVANEQLKVGNYAKASELFRRALQLAPFKQGSNVSSAFLSQIGLVQSEIGLNRLDSAKADLHLVPVYEPSILGNPKPDNAAEFYALIDYLEGNFESAKQKLLPLVSKNNTVKSQQSHILQFLADVSRREGNKQQAVDFLRQSIDILELSAPNPEGALEVGIAPQTQQLDRRLDQAICLALDSPDDANTARFAVETALGIKGRQLIAAIDYTRGLHSIPMGAEVKLQRLREVQSSLSMLLWECALDPLITPDWIEIQRLVDNESQLKQEFQNWKVSGAEPPISSPMSFKQIQEALSPDSGFLEITMFQRFDLIKSELEGQPSGDPHYAVVLIGSQGEPRWYDIGSVSAVNSELSKFRMLITTTRAAEYSPSSGQSPEELVPAYPESDIRQAGSALYNQIFHNGLGSIRRLVVSADGDLNGLPFAALVGEDGQYLRDRLSVSYLVLPSDLIQNNAGDRQAANRKVVVFADPDFGWKEPLSNSAISNSEIQPRPAQNSGRRSGTDDGRASREVFTQLPGAEREAKDLKRLFPDADLYLQKTATKAALLAIHKPIVLHIATHAEFIDSHAETSKDTDVGPVAFDNPMIRANIVLAGANASLRSRSESSVSALELSSIDLEGTELVVLSACKTALGATSLGEGVYGLRRGVAMAGAKRSVLSLWKVDDDATAEFMKNLYDSVTRGKTIGAALSEAQRVLKESSAIWGHPYYWAAFVLSGRDSAIPELNRPQGRQIVNPLAEASSSKPVANQGYACHTKWTYNGLADNPTVSGSLVLFGTREGTLYALDSATGQEKWRFPTGNRILRPPTIANDTAYFGNYGGEVYAVELSTGQRKWDFAVKDEVAMKLTVIDGVVYAGTLVGDLHALDARTGHELWRFSVNKNDSDLAVHIIYWVAIHEGFLYLGDSDGQLYCLSPGTGKLVWTLKLPAGLPAPPSFAVGLAFLGSHDHFIYAIRLDAHQVEWKYQLGDEVDWTPIVVGSLLVAVPQGVSSEQLTALDLQSGQLKWQYQLYDPVTTALIREGDQIYFGGQKGLYVFNLNRGETHLLDSSKFVTSSPAVTSDAVYYSDFDRQLHALACE